ncbi:MAG: hypothetical protein MK098_08865 [Marinovum sp.]|nr:hypothetical protein [Marinovum sp.]
MLLERTLFQLDVGAMSPERALQMGQLGYMQWLGALRPEASYSKEASHALAMARSFEDGSPAVAVFCELLQTTLNTPLQPLALRLPERSRRGGAQARRLSI